MLTVSEGQSLRFYWCTPSDSDEQKLHRVEVWPQILTDMRPEFFSVRCYFKVSVTQQIAAGGRCVLAVPNE